MREEPQMRQSEGNKTEKRLWAVTRSARSIPNRPIRANLLRGGVRSRVRPPLLLKTTLLVEADAGVAKPSITLFRTSLQWICFDLVLCWFGSRAALLLLLPLPLASIT